MLRIKESGLNPGLIARGSWDEIRTSWTVWDKAILAEEMGVKQLVSDSPQSAGPGMADQPAGRSQERVQGARRDCHHRPGHTGSRAVCADGFCEVLDITKGRGNRTRESTLSLNSCSSVVRVADHRDLAPQLFRGRRTATALRPHPRIKYGAGSNLPQHRRGKGLQVLNPNCSNTPGAQRKALTRCSAFFNPALTRR